MKWQLKVAVQAVLAHVPGGEAINHRLQRAGGGYTPEALRVRIDEAIGFLTSIDPPLHIAGKRIVEIGTGWDGIHPILLSILGAERVTTFDHVRHLRRELAMLVVREVASHPRMVELVAMDSVARERVEKLLECDELDALLRVARIDYIAPGDATDTGLRTASIDVVYNFYVLEHVSETVLDGLLTETKRILAPGGIMVSSIGTGDHYSSVQSSVSQVNFLKFPEWVWAPLVKNKISYHNRLREKQFIDRFVRFGGRVQWKKSHVEQRDLAVASTMKVNRRFAGMTPEELAVYRSDLVIDFPSGAAPNVGGNG